MTPVSPQAEHADMMILPPTEPAAAPGEFPVQMGTGRSDAFDRLREVCEGKGLPVDVDALVRHVEGNVGLAKYTEGFAAGIEHEREARS